MNDLTFASVEKDGIEFYVSNDGEQTGMSIRGLARCCGVQRQSILGFLEGVGKSANKILKPFGSNLFIDQEGVGNIENNATIVKSEVCARVIQYYAYESKNAANETAKNTLCKFAIIGIDNWIKDLMGFDNKTKTIHYGEINSKLDKLLSVVVQQKDEIDKITNTLNEMKPIVEEYNTVQNGIRATFRGLETVIDHVKNEQYILPSGNLYTLSEWLQTKDVTLGHGSLRKLGRTVAETFKTCTVAQPKKKNYLKPNGKWSCNCTAYSEEHFPLLEMALTQFMQS